MTARANLHPLTLASIELQGRDPDFEQAYHCGCEKRRQPTAQRAVDLGGMLDAGIAERLEALSTDFAESWWLCEYHEGYEDAAQAQQEVIAG